MARAASALSTASSVTSLSQKDWRKSSFATLNFAVVGGNLSLRDDLCQHLTELSAESEFRHCAAVDFGSLKELAERGPKVTENALIVVVVDTTSASNCGSINEWLRGLRELQFFGKVCIAIYNVHRVSESTCSAEFLQGVRMKHRPIPIFFHGPDKAKWRPLVASILRWGEIAAGFRGDVTMQYLGNVMKQPDVSGKT